MSFTQAEKLFALTQAVARHLAGWSAARTEQDDLRGVTYLRSSEREITLQWSYPHQRIEIRGNYPLPPWPYALAPKITVSAEKDPARIAREIERRFLPAYLPLYDAQQKRKAQAQEFERARTARLEQLRAALRLPEDSLEGEGDRLHLSFGARGSGEFSVTDPEAVRITLWSVPPVVALRMADVLREFLQESW